MPPLPPRPRRVLGLLQNQWFKDPVRAAALLARYQEHEGGFWPGRHRFIRDMLFFGCLTGRRLEAAFGEDLCGYGGLVWEEVSTCMGDHPGACFPPDGEHVAAVLRQVRPVAVVAFGKVARDALALPEVQAHIVQRPGRPPTATIYAPHPAARGADVPNELRAAAARVREILDASEG